MARGFVTQIDVSAGLAKPIAALRRLRELGEVLTPFMEDARSIMLASTLNRFRESKGPGGIPWAPTKRQIAHAVGPNGPHREHKTLIDTGGLLSSIQGETTSNTAEVGSKAIDVPGKLANQFGAHGPSVVGFHTRTVTTLFGAPLASPLTEYVSSHVRVTNLPARPFIGIDEQDETDIKDAWQARIIGTFGNGG